MKSLLRIEWLKLKNYGAFKIIFILFAVGIFLTNYIVFMVNKNIIEKAGQVGTFIGFTPYSFYNTWQTTSYASGYLLILPAMLMIIITTNEYTYKTSRQNIIDGWSRQQFINVKLVMGLILALIPTVLVLISASIAGVLSGTDFSMNHFSHVGFFFLKAVSYNVIAVFVSVLVKRPGFAIGLYFIYLGAENIASQLLDFLSLKLKAQSHLDLGSLGDYLPMNAADGLLTFPENNLKSMTKGVLPTEYFWVVLAFALVYLFIFLWLTHRKFMKSDL